MHAIRRPSPLPIAASIVAVVALVSVYAARAPLAELARTLGELADAVEARLRPGSQDAGRPAQPAPSAGGSRSPALSAVGLPGRGEALGVAVGDGFVSVGPAGVRRSKDAVAWSVVPGAPAGLRAVVAGGPGFVAGGADGLAWSRDGVSWSASTRVGPESVKVQALAADGSAIVGVGFDGENRLVAIRSLNGRRWSTLGRLPDVAGASPSKPPIVRAVLRTGPMLVVVLEPETAVGAPVLAAPVATSSTDGITWSRPVALPGPAASVGAMVAHGARLVAVGSVDDGAGRDGAAWTSDDRGASWSAVTHDENVFGGAGSQRLDAVTVTSAGLLAAGPLGDNTVGLWQSADGSRWTRSPGRLPAAGTSVSALAAGSGTVVGVGASGETPVAWRVTTESPPVSRQSPWVAAAVPGGGQVAAVRATPDGFVAGGSVGATGRRRAAAWWSTDGRRWNSASLPDPVSGDETIAAVARAGPFFVAVGTAGDDMAAWRSDDGRAWERAQLAPEVAGGPGRQLASGVASGPSGVLAVGRDDATGTLDGAVWRTVDGRAWERVAVATPEAGLGGLDDELLRAVLWDGASWVAVGGGGARSETGDLDLDARFWTSADGSSWTRLPVDDSASGGPGDEAAVAVDRSAGGVIAAGYRRGVDGAADAVVWRISPGQPVERDLRVGWAGPGADAVNGIAVGSGGRIVAAGVRSGPFGQDLRTWVDATADADQPSVGAGDGEEFALAVAVRGDVAVAAGSHFWWRRFPAR